MAGSGADDLQRPAQTISVGVNTGKKISVSPLLWHPKILVWVLNVSDFSLTGL